MATWNSGASRLAPALKDFPNFCPGVFEYDGVARGVYRAGTGPAVVVIHEVPNIYDDVFIFAQKLCDRGFTTFLPSLVGKPGGPFKVSNAFKSMTKICVSRAFKTFAFREESPVAEWLRALARHAHDTCGGPGVGAVGMCLSGGFALAMMVDPSVIAPVLSQPSLPLAVSSQLSADIDTNAADIPAIRQRLEAEDLCVLGLRFSHDKFVPEARFTYLEQCFGDRFVGVTIDSSPGNPHGNSRIAHSVLTRDLVEQDDHPTYQAFEKVVTLFEQKLLSATSLKSNASQQ